ncbi:DUF421 domain-containing protein [Bacillus massilinigeriensis]|uniref:DUF421 domain-containing protein n=1 Tax=Bacillus mediterraneensis TaxID=1805474 RepID=UPI0008F8CCFA|nr:DUF421 domain-containing protein [Bacillus mediterraneensis]
MPEYTSIVVRSFIFLFLLFVITKLVGKKQLAELSFFEYASGITIGSIAGEVIMGLENNIMHGVSAIIIFGVLTYLVDVLSIKSKSFRDTVEGKATILIKGGKVLEENLRKEKYSIDELSSLLRKKGVFDYGDVELAVLEPKGDLSVLLKRNKQPLTPGDFNMHLEKEKETHIIIMDGYILDGPLMDAGRSKKWVYDKLGKKGISVKDVFIGQVDNEGKMEIDLYDDGERKQGQEKGKH